MQLKLQRSQRNRGVLSSTVFFCLDVRADFNEEERANINRYKLGGQAIYSSRAAQQRYAEAAAHLDSVEGETAGRKLLGLARSMASVAIARTHLNISIASLARGHHIECKDLEELLESEDTIRGACKTLTRFLEIASTFDGSELIVEYVDGEERLHVARDVPPLLDYAGTDGAAEVAGGDEKQERAALPARVESEAMKEFVLLGRMVRDLWDRLGTWGPIPRYAIVAGGGLLLVLLLRSCAP